MEDLKTSYLDDILSASMGGKRKFRLTKADGSAEEVTIEDISEYEQVGSTFGAGDLNNICDTVNNKFDSDDVVDPMLATAEGFAADAKVTGEVLSELNSNLTASDETPFRFGVNENGEYGYIVTGEDGADTVIPFSNINLGGEICYVCANGSDVVALIVKRDGTRLLKGYKKDGGNFDISGDVFRVVSSVVVGSSFYSTVYSLIEGTINTYYNGSKTITVTENQVLVSKGTGVRVFEELYH